MERSGRDHGRGLKAWTPPGHNHLSLAGCCFSPSWPPQRSPSSSSSAYTCGYCRREFRSAQALGGHMNVHRRDRARLRQLRPPPSSSQLPSPSHRFAALPNLNFMMPSPQPPHCAGSTTTTVVVAGEPVVYSFFSSSSTSASAAAATKAAADLEVSLELGIGVCGAGAGAGAVEEEEEEEDGLDLELRLGCAWE